MSRNPVRNLGAWRGGRANCRGGFRTWYTQSLVFWEKGPEPREGGMGSLITGDRLGPVAVINRTRRPASLRHYLHLCCELRSCFCMSPELQGQQTAQCSVNDLQTSSTTRRHSSRMRTACILPYTIVSEGGLPNHPPHYRPPGCRPPADWPYMNEI